MMSEFIAELFDGGSEARAESLYFPAMISVVAAAGALLFFFFSAFASFIDIVTFTGFLAAPVVAWANQLVICGDNVPAEHRPGDALVRWNQVAVVVLLQRHHAPALGAQRVLRVGAHHCLREPLARQLVRRGRRATAGERQGQVAMRPRASARAGRREGAGGAAGALAPGATGGRRVLREGEARDGALHRSGLTLSFG